MVKLNYEEFVSEVDKLFTQTKEKNSLNFSFKRVYDEKFKHKKSQKCRRLRREDRILQDSVEERQYSVLFRCKLKKKRFHTIIEPKDIGHFHNVLMKIFSLNFIVAKNENKPKIKITAKKKKSNKQKRKEKKEKKLRLRLEKMEIKETTKPVESN